MNVVNRSQVRPVFPGRPSVGPNPLIELAIRVRDPVRVTLRPDDDELRLTASFAAAVSGSERMHSERAPRSHREVGVAHGVLPAPKLWTLEHALHRLRDASQQLHHKLRDIAFEVVRTGELPAPPRLTPVTGRATQRGRDLRAPSGRPVPSSAAAWSPPTFSEWKGPCDGESYG